MRRETIPDRVLRTSVGIKVEGGLSSALVRALVNEFGAEQPLSDPSDGIAGFLALEDIPQARRQDFLSSLDFLATLKSNGASPERPGAMLPRAAGLRDAPAIALPGGEWVERARTEFARAQRYHRPLSLAVLDLDGVAALDDDNAEPVIASLTALCLSELRHSDLFAPLGEAGFGLLTPETSAPGAITLVERIRILFASTPVDPETRLYATVSIGIAELGAGTADFDALIRQAGDALERAQRAGGNRTAVAGKTPETLPAPAA